MKPSEVAQAACDKLSFTDANTLALAKKFCIRRYSMIWDSCLWNDTLGVISRSVSQGNELVTLDQTVTATYASGTGYNMFLDFPVAIRFTINGETDGIEVPAAEWVSFFQLDPNTWNNVDSRKSTPGNFVNWTRIIGASYGEAGVPRIKLVPTPNTDGTLFVLGKKSVAAFIADEKAASQLAQSVKNLGLAFETPRIEKFIDWVKANVPSEIVESVRDSSVDAILDKFN